MDEKKVAQTEQAEAKVNGTEGAGAEGNAGQEPITVDSLMAELATL